MTETLKFIVYRYVVPENSKWWNPFTWIKKEILYQGNDFDKTKETILNNWPSVTKTLGPGIQPSEPWPRR